jgi:hypothetical protein
MPTRFYFTATAAPAITPAYGVEWDKTTNAVRRLLSQGKNTTIAATSSDAEIGASSPYDILNRQVISKPLKAQTIGGTVKGQMLCSQNADDADMCCRAMVIKVVSADGGTVRGTLLSQFPASLTSEFVTGTLTNRNFPPSTALNPVTCQDGDYLVIEGGVRAFNATATSKGFSLRYRDSAALPDLPEDETDINDYCSWIEFSQTIQFTDSQSVSHVIAQVEYVTVSRETVSQLSAQVEYVLTPPGQFTIEAPVTVAINPSGTTGSPEFTKDAEITVSLDVSKTSTIFQPAGSSIADAEVTVSLTPAPDTFNIHAADARVTVNLNPSGTLTSCTVFKTEAIIEIAFLPQAASRLPIIGWDKASGYGFVDVTWLSDTPPFYVPDTGLELEIDPTAASHSLYAELKQTAEGGIVFQGEPTLTIKKAGTYQEEGLGGIDLGGQAVVVVRQPVKKSYVGDGGLRIGGQAIVQVTDPKDASKYSFTVWGGLEIGGTPALKVTTPKTYSFVGSGGIAFGGFQVPDVVVTRPSVFTEDKIDIVASGGLWFEGDTLLKVTRPGKISIEAEAFILWFSGEPGLAVLRPRTIEEEGEGGLILGEEEAPAVCDSWMLSGVDLEPSMYSRFNFNSYALSQGKGYAAGQDGIYLLEGLDDDGEVIHPGVRIGNTNFGDSGPKRIRSIYLSEGNDNAEIRVVAGDKEGYFSKARSGWKVSRDMRAREFVIDIGDFEELSHLEIVPFVLAKG